MARLNDSLVLHLVQKFVYYGQLRPGLWAQRLTKRTVVTGVNVLLHDVSTAKVKFVFGEDIAVGCKERVQFLLRLSGHGGVDTIQDGSQI